MNAHDEDFVDELLRRVASEKRTESLSPERAQAEYDAAPPEPLSREQIDRFVRNLVRGHRGQPLEERPVHPDALELDRYSLGQLSEHKYREIDSHLVACCHCFETVVSAMSGPSQEADTPERAAEINGVLWIGRECYPLIGVARNEWIVRGLSVIDAVQIRNREAVWTRVITRDACLRGMTERNEDPGAIRLAAGTKARSQVSRAAQHLATRRVNLLYEWTGDGHTFQLLEYGEEVHLQWH